MRALGARSSLLLPPRRPPPKASSRRCRQPRVQISSNYTGAVDRGFRRDRARCADRRPRRELRDRRDGARAARKTSSCARRSGSGRSGSTRSSRNFPTRPPISRCCRRGRSTRSRPPSCASDRKDRASRRSSMRRTSPTRAAAPTSRSGRRSAAQSTGSGSICRDARGVTFLTPAIFRAGDPAPGDRAAGQLRRRGHALRRQRSCWPRDQTIRAGQDRLRAAGRRSSRARLVALYGLPRGDGGALRLARQRHLPEGLILVSGR